ncbi:MAG: hypothetical protein ABJB16_06345 [Saprospiraceae bacterium]
MRFFLLFGFLTLLLSNCAKQKNNLNIQSNGQLTLIDSSSQSKNLLYYSVIQNDCNYPIHFLGQNSDTIRLQKKHISIFGQKVRGINDHMIADSNNMTFFVDTFLNLSYTVDYQHYLDDGKTRIIDSTIDYKAFPIIIRNISDSVLYISDCWNMDNVIRQVKTKNGIWRDIEKGGGNWHAMRCEPIFLEPNYILIAKLTLYKGDTKVECRLKYKNWKTYTFSNTFYDHLPQKQFADPL